LGVQPLVCVRLDQGLLIERLENLAYHQAGGRPGKLTPTQKKRLCELVDAGPQAAGLQPACWTTFLVQELIQLPRANLNLQPSSH
jgi:transposase